MQKKIHNQIAESASVLSAMLQDTTLLAEVETIAKACINGLGNGNKLLFMSNGGSAADAQHLAGEMVNRFAFGRPGLPAFALTVDTSALTSIGNDYGFELLFSRQVKAVGKSGDILFGFSTSGRSPNILRGFETQPRRWGLSAIRKPALLSSSTTASKFVPPAPPRFRRVISSWATSFCGLVDKKLFPCPT